MMKSCKLYLKMDLLQRDFNNSQMMELVILKKVQMMKERMRIMKIISIHKHSFLHYPSDLVKTEQLMMFSIEHNMIVKIRDLNGHIMKFHQLMSLILLDI